MVVVLKDEQRGERERREERRSKIEREKSKNEDCPGPFPRFNKKKMRSKGQK